MPPPPPQTDQPNAYPPPPPRPAPPLPAPSGNACPWCHRVALAAVLRGWFRPQQQQQQQQQLGPAAAAAAAVAGRQLGPAAAAAAAVAAAAGPPPLLSYTRLSFDHTRPRRGGVLGPFGVFARGGGGRWGPGGGGRGAADVSSCRSAVFRSGRVTPTRKKKQKERLSPPHKLAACRLGVWCG
mgnify:CR=1 FL=1